MKENRPNSEQMNELVFELITLCKRWGMWEDVYIGCGDKRYTPAVGGKACDFHGLTDVLIEKNDRPCSETGIMIWPDEDKGVFPELVCFGYDPEEERTLSERSIEYLASHDEKFKLFDKQRRDHIEEINQRIKEYRDKIIFDHTDLDDTEFDDYYEFDEYHHGELSGYEQKIMSLEDELYEFGEHIAAELYGNRTFGNYCEIPALIIAELKELAKKYDMFIMTEDCREFYIDPWCDFAELTENFLPKLIYIPDNDD